MKINSDSFTKLTTQFRRIGDFANRTREFAPFVLDQIGGKYPGVKVNVVDKVVTKLPVIDGKRNEVAEDIIDDTIKVLLKND